MEKAKNPRAEAVLDFWFGELTREDWFKKDADLDETIRRRFLSFHKAVSVDPVAAWTETAPDCLAAIVTLDQFSRNMFRDTPQAFASDPKALEIANRAIEAGYDKRFPDEQRIFFYLPLEHSEVMADQDRCCALMGALEDQSFLEYSDAHRVIVRRFGRFPHRNAVLGRESTPAEIEFLKEPGSSF